MPILTYAQALNQALREEMQADPRVFLMGEDIGHHGGIFRVTKDLIDEFGEERVRDTPISESSFVGFGIGAAMLGMRPVVELLFMDFALVAADQETRALRLRLFQNHVARRPQIRSLASDRCTEVNQQGEAHRERGIDGRSPKRKIDQAVDENSRRRD